MDDKEWKLSSSTQTLLNISVTLFSLILLYLPKTKCLFIFSPIIVAATVLFLILLRCSTPQKIKPQPQFRADDDQIEAGAVTKSSLDYNFADFDVRQFRSFLEWDVGAPLEVIYEEEDPENEDEESNNNNTCLQRHTSLSRYFPESDSDTSSSDEYPDWDSPGRINCCNWDEDDTNGLIEISLDSKKYSDFEQDDSMFEIDISPASSSRIPAS
ncbi:hypothetical protein QQ045_008465 [Rhodiola kirilowii]